MDSQPSGNNNELLVVETDKVLFVLKGEKYGVSSEANISVESFPTSWEKINFHYKENLHLKEYSDYEIIIESKTGAEIDFYHDNINIRNKVTPVTSRSKNLSGIINFKGDIGLTQFVIKADNKEEFKITMEVFPGKISYKEDYQALLNDVNKEIYNLAYGFLARTYLGSDINKHTNNSDTEFYSILNYVFDKLKKSIDIVLNNPNHILRKEDKVVKYHNIRKTTKDTIKYLEKRPHLMKEVNDNRYLPCQALITKKTMTMDTKENRLLKFMLLKIMDKINKFQNNYKKSYRNNDEIIIKKLLDMKKEIAKRINSSFLRNIDDQFNDASMSLVFSMGSGYREVYKYYLMLQKGLSIKSSVFSLSIKELSLLYEYWCFIKINSLLKKKYKLIGGDLLKINRDGITVSLTKGRKSCLKYENPETKEKFTVYYNFQTSKRKGNDYGKEHSIYSKTVTQKPDNILSMYKDGSSKSYEFIFDAKYKIDYSDAYINAYNTPGPKEEDINTMHRYRDAIVYENKTADGKSKVDNCIFGAFVLFPYNDEEEFRENTFYKSINEVNIGGIPFLPSSTKLMEEFLDEIINESSYLTFERAIDKVNKENYLSEEEFEKRNVLIGIVKSKEQFEININNNFYHIPVKNVNLASHNIEYIALYQSKSAFNDDGGILYYGKVSNMKIVKRSEIQEIPKDSSEIYYRIEVNDWIKLYRKIEISSFGIRRNAYTNIYLLRNSENISELFIRTYKEFRIFRELKRISNSRSGIIYEDNQSGKDESSLKNMDYTADKYKVDAFRIDDVTVLIQKNTIESIRHNESIVKVSYEEFVKSSVKAVRKLLGNK